jgi:hypothetical protein
VFIYCKNRWLRKLGLAQTIGSRCTIAGIGIQYFSRISIQQRDRDVSTAIDSRSKDGFLPIGLAKIQLALTIANSLRDPIVFKRFSVFRHNALTI